MEPVFKRICIIGIGLIGGSLGMALMEKGAGIEVIGVDLDQDNLELALNCGAVHWGTASLEEGVKGCDLVVLATPVGAYSAILATLAPVLAPGTIVTDVGSTKERVVGEAESLLPANVYFVGGHPMAGSEQAGVKGADPYLFENAVYLLTPTGKTNPQALLKVAALGALLGARVMQFSPTEHDIMVAAVSHLPHLVAVTLVNAVRTIAGQHPHTLLLAAGGFRDTTRVALGSTVMWKDICLSNRNSILQVLAGFKAELENLEREIRSTDDSAISESLTAARALRSQVPTKLKGYWPELYEVIVTVPDQPGTIAEVAAILADAGINISDIEILRVREGAGGTIRLGFTQPGSDEAAVDVLLAAGIKARKR